jgi:DNA-directed RNA polymerase I subunit RPA2
LEVLVEDTLVSSFTRNVGLAPVMVQSELCNLHGLSPEQLVERREDHNEMGGYFIINGNEKVVR